MVQGLGGFRVTLRDCDEVGDLLVMSYSRVMMSLSQSITSYRTPGSLNVLTRDERKMN